MEEFKTSKSVPKFWIIVFILLLMVSAGVAAFLLKKTTFIYSKTLPFSPFQEGVTSYGVSQKLYVMIDNIQTDPATGEVTITFAPLSEDMTAFSGEKPEKKMSGEEMLALTQSILYWDSETDQWYEHSERPENIQDKLEIADIALVVYDKFYQAEDIVLSGSEPVTTFIRIDALIK